MSHTLFHPNTHRPTVGLESGSNKPVPFAPWWGACVSSHLVWLPHKVFGGDLRALATALSYNFRNFKRLFLT